MELEIVTATDADLPGVLTPVLTSFADNGRSDEDWEDEALVFADYRLLAARTDDGWVGDVADFSFDLTLPGGATVPASGVTMVGVLPTHRRRGIVTALLGRLLDDAAGRGEPVAILLASEASIYGRFGFGVASQRAKVRLDAGASAYAHEPVDTGSMRLVADPAEAIVLAERVWERHRRWRPGTITRRPWMWELMRRDREKHREGRSALFWAVHVDAGGEPDGYVAYRIKEDDAHGLSRWEAHAEDLVGVDADVEAVLLRYLCDLDLVHTVQVSSRPIDEPLRWRLRDPRQLVVQQQYDWLWARVLDAPVAMAARRYGAADRLVVQVDDPFRPASGGRFAIDGGPDHAACERTDDAAELTLDASAFGSLLLGTLAPSLLASAGRVQATPDVLRRADAFFASSPAPFSCTGF